MASFKENFLKMMERGRISPDEDVDSTDEDDATPYSSLTREGAPEPVITPDLDGESDTRAQEQALPPKRLGSAPSIPPAPDELESRAPNATPKDPISADPLMAKFEQDQARLSDLREAQRGANSIAGIGAATQQLALGVNKPQVSDAILRNSQRTGEDLLKSEQHGAENRARVISAIEARKQRESLQHESAATRRQRQLEMDKYKEDKLNDDLIRRMQNDLDPDKARGGNFAKNAARVQQADRLKGLYTEANGDIRNLDSRQLEEMSLGMAKLLSDTGASGRAQVEALVPKSVWGDGKKLAEWLTNDPKGTDQIEFVKRMAETIEREREIASNQVKSAQVSRLSAFEKLKHRDPDRYNQIIQAYDIDPAQIDENGRYKPAVKEAAQKPVRMIDPRSGKIRLVRADQVDAAKAAGGKLADEADDE